MSKVREKQLQKRKQETLEVALRLLMERGYANLNMDELADEVGISKPTLYQYFNSKDELMAQVFVHMLEHIEDHFEETSEKTPIEQLEQFLRSMLKSRTFKRNMMGNVDFETMRSIIHRYPYTIERLTAVRTKLGLVVKKAQDLGEIDPTLPSWVVVNAMFSLQGILNNPFMKGETQRSEDELNEAIECIVRMFKRSVSIEIPVTPP